MSILLVDSYDSFTFNLKNLIESSTGAKVYTIHNDTFRSDEFDILDRFLDNFNAIIIGPGPGNPRSSEDVGMIPYLLTKTQIPILGICLGFQCLCSAYGAQTLYLDSVKHGQVYDIQVEGDNELFQGMKNFKSVRYHSIYVELNENSDLIVPLAFTEDERQKVLMAVKHKSYPHYGVQYHPESICSEKGDILVKNFWKIAQDFNKLRSIKEGDLNHDEHVIRPIPLFKPQLQENYQDVNFKETCIGSSNIDICDHFKKTGVDFLLLNSASAPGEWSIIGLPIPLESDVLSHSTQDPHNVRISKWKGEGKQDLTLGSNSSIWSFIADYMDLRSFNTIGKSNDFPFVGGLIGFFSYEEGEFIDVKKLDSITKGNIPDTKLCFIERVLLHDLKNNKHYVLSIRPNDDAWITEMIRTLSKIQPIGLPLGSVKDLLQDDEKIHVETPHKEEYFTAFQECLHHLQKGDSYELCLTTCTKLKIPSRISSWDMYKVLTSKNPSPYSCFLKFDDAELLSSSPERFLSWNDDFCQLRPIKGTVKKSVEMTLEKLTSLLKTPKEMGENLMIVDLIRHDLYTFLNDIEVVQLMTVEEYKTVYQLVSVINGSFANSTYRGLDVLSKSLPPGSMTGAPKKRSVEILQNLEKHKRRGIYSGVCGYYSVNNKSDWSVVIRSCFKYKDDLENDAYNDIWRIGAGGAITVLSNCEGEWEEMEIKLESALQAFK